MKSKIENTNEVCKITLIADYLEGELVPTAENEIELHLTRCENCREELNFQKQFLGALDSELENLPELPENFTKTIVVNAESKVEGLRGTDERFRALFICAVLFLLVILGLGSETKAVFSAFGSFINQIFAVGSFAARLLFDLMVGLAVIVKFLSHQISLTNVLGIIFFAAIVGFVLFLISRSKLVFSRS